LENNVSEFEQRIGYTFTERELLRRALTHKSYSHEAKELDVRHNETFEFLGDSVLGFVVGDMLFRHFPKLDEGALSKMKAFLVSAPSLAAKARHFGMGEVILLGVGEEKTGGRKKDSLLANLFEAMIAGVYLDGGIDAARQLIERAFRQDIINIDQQDLLFQDYKTALQELAQGKGCRCRTTRGGRGGPGSRQDLHRRSEARRPRHARRRLVEKRSAAAGRASGAGGVRRKIRDACVMHVMSSRA
jgi:ribonuclease-3